MGGGGKERGGGQPHEGDPSQKQVLEPPSSGMFSTRLRCRCSCLPVQKSKTQHTRSSVGGVPKKSFLEGALSGTFSSPIRFAPPHNVAQRKSLLFLVVFLPFSKQGEDLSGTKTLRFVKR